MKVLDCDVRWPGFGQITLAVAMAVGIWSLQFLFGVGSKTAADAGENLAAIMFGFVSNAIGISVVRGWKPLLLNIIGCVLVLMGYRFVVWLLAG